MAALEPRIISAREWLVVGMSFYGDPFQQAAGWSEENEIGRLWNRFSVFSEGNPDAIKHRIAPDAGLEIHLWTDETASKGYYEVFVGVVVSRLGGVPLQCSVKVLPATQYAVVTLRGKEITADWGNRIYRDWLPASDYVEAHQYMIEYYDERFHGLAHVEKSEIDVYVPIRPAGV
jgi:predicted transcriptional regulator YdeE